VSADSHTIELRKNEEQKMSIVLRNIGHTEIDWKVSGIPDLLTISEESGLLDRNSEKAISLNVDGSKLTNQVLSFTLSFEYGDPENTTIDLPVSVKLKLNQAPKVIMNIDDQEVMTFGDPINFDLKTIFNDPDGDSLQFSFETNTSDAGTFRQAMNLVTFTPLKSGTVNVILSAEDTYNSKTSTFFKIDVSSVTGTSALHDYVPVTNSPNPFDKETFFTYQLEKRANVNLVIRDTNGRVVGQPVDGEQPAGVHQVLFNDELVSGLYLYHLVINGRVTGSGKMVRK
jgi:hypothetical protein